MTDNMQAKTRFRALYYPYSRCLYKTDLKRAVLVFDEILFVDPLSQEVIMRPGQYLIRDPRIEIRSLLDASRSRFLGPYGKFFLDTFFKEETRDYTLPEWYSIVDIYKTLSQHGIARLVFPQDHLQHHQEILTFSLLRDFCQGVTYDQMDYWDRTYLWESDTAFQWKVHTSRIPGLLVELRSAKDVLLRCIEQTNENLDRDDRNNRLMVIEEVLSTIAKSLQESKDDEVMLPFAIAYLLILNQALLLCEELQAFPVTDDNFAHAGLLTKVSNLYSSSEKSVRSILPHPTASDLYRIQSFTLAVISQLIPDEALDRLEMEQIITFRERNKEALQRFRDKMVEMASTITNKPWEPDFQTQVLRIIEGKIIPEVHILDDELRDSYRKLFGTAISKLVPALGKIVAPALPTITMATLFGLSAGQIVMLGATAIMGGLGITLPDLVEHWQDRRVRERNGLAFLLRFRNQRIKPRKL